MAETNAKVFKELPLAEIGSSFNFIHSIRSLVENFELCTKYDYHFLIFMFKADPVPSLICCRTSVKRRGSFGDKKMDNSTLSIFEDLVDVLV